MRRTLRIYGAPVLNFRELQQLFSPMELYAQSDIFAGFAAVHCVPIPVILKDSESGETYPAQGCTKKFWHTMLLSFLSDESCDPQQDFAQLCENYADEVKDADLLRKLDFIREKTGRKDDNKEALILLAICELAEADPEQTQWSIRNQEKAEDASNGTGSGLSEADPQETAQITYFPYEQTASLVTGETYRYWYHDDEKLKEDAVIQTVKITAAGGLNHYKKARIELCAESTGQCIRVLELNVGEFRYCTVSRGRIIEFLPNLSISDDLCLARPDSVVRIHPKDRESWNVDGEDVSCFAAGLQSQGFLLVRNGRLNYQLYKGISNFNTRLQLEMIVLPAVGVRISAGGFEVLLEDGTVVSDQAKKRRLNEITLNPDNRFPYPQQEMPAGCRETAVSETGRSRALILEDTESEMVYFD